MPDVLSLAVPLSSSFLINDYRLIAPADLLGERYDWPIQKLGADQGDWLRNERLLVLTQGI
ncbi:MAG: hypothetical protein AAGJ38_10840 [Planctomycetota bacterium]